MLSLDSIQRSAPDRNTHEGKAVRGLRIKRAQKSPVAAGLLCNPSSFEALGISDSGGLGRNRTTDTRIFNPLLYQLSYQAIFRLSAGC
jgi:hypothetical protein